MCVCMCARAIEDVDLVDVLCGVGRGVEDVGMVGDVGSG